MNRQYVLAVAFLGIAGCASSGPESTAPASLTETSAVTDSQVVAEGAMEKADVVDENELVCTRERLTGSRIPTKVCLTRAERERLQKEAQGYIEHDRRKPGSNPSK